MSDLINYVKLRDCDGVKKTLVSFPTLNLEERDSSGWGTALHWAIYKNDKDIVIHLLDNKADYTAKTAEEKGWFSTTPPKNTFELAQANKVILAILEKKKAYDESMRINDIKESISKLKELLKNPIEYPKEDTIQSNIKDKYDQLFSKIKKEPGTSIQELEKLRVECSPYIQEIEINTLILNKIFNQVDRLISEKKYQEALDFIRDNLENTRNIGVKNLIKEHNLHFHISFRKAIAHTGLSKNPINKNQSSYINQAKSYYEEIIKSQIGHKLLGGEAYLNLGTLFEAEGNLKEAEDCYIKAEAFESVRTKARNNLSAIKEKKEAKTKVTEKLHYHCAVFSSIVYAKEWAIYVIVKDNINQNLQKYKNSYVLVKEPLGFFYVTADKKAPCPLDKNGNDELSSLLKECKFGNEQLSLQDQRFDRKQLKRFWNFIRYKEKKDHRDKDLENLTSYPGLNDYELYCTTSMIDNGDTTLSFAGYFGAAYINKKEKQCIIAHCGTDLFENGDLAADLLLIGHRIHPQFALADKLTKNVKNLMEQDNMGDFKIVHTGHSLGAVIAEVTAWSYNHKAVTFESPGAVPFIKRLNSNREREPIEDIKSKLEKTITCYLTSPNFVNTLHEHVGTLYYLSGMSVDTKYDSNWTIPKSLSIPIPYMPLPSIPFPEKLIKFLDYLEKRARPISDIISRDLNQHDMSRILQEFSKIESNNYIIPRRSIKKWPRGPWQYAELAMLMIEARNPDPSSLKQDTNWNYFKELIHYDIESSSNVPSTTKPGSSHSGKIKQNPTSNSNKGEQKIQDVSRYLCPAIHHTKLENTNPQDRNERSISQDVTESSFKAKL